MILQEVDICTKHLRKEHLRQDISVVLIVWKSLKVGKLMKIEIIKGILGFEGIFF